MNKLEGPYKSKRRSNCIWDPMCAEHSCDPFGIFVTSHPDFLSKAVKQNGKSCGLRVRRSTELGESVAESGVTTWQHVRSGLCQMQRMAAMMRSLAAKLKAESSGSVNFRNLVVGVAECAFKKKLLRPCPPFLLPHQTLRTAPRSLRSVAVPC